MDGVLLDQIKAQMLDEQLADLFISGAQIGLLGTVTSIDQTDTDGTLLVNEIAFTGYSRQTLLSWTGAVLTGHKAKSYSPSVNFANTGGTDSPSITGWFYYSTHYSKLIMAGLFDVPFVIPAGAAYATTPFFESASEITSEP